MKNAVKFIQKYSVHIKYGLVVVALFAMILSIKIYQNYISILDAIDTVKQDVQNKTEEIKFTQNFYTKYLESEYADYFLAHENNILFKNEYIIRLDTNPPQKKLDDKNSSGQNKIITEAKKSRNDFILKKLNLIK